MSTGSNNWFIEVNKQRYSSSINAVQYAVESCLEAFIDEKGTRKRYNITAYKPEKKQRGVK